MQSVFRRRVAAGKGSTDFACDAGRDHNLTGKFRLVPDLEFGIKCLLCSKLEELNLLPGLLLASGGSTRRH